MTTCDVVPMKYAGDGHYAALSKYFPERNHKEKGSRVLVDPVTIKLTGLHGNATLLCFATQPKKGILARDIAYGKLQNSAVYRASPKGIAIVTLSKPSQYVDTDGKIHPLHMHFVYWDTTKACWSYKIHTRRIII